MLSSLPQFTTDEISPSPQPAPLPLLEESAAAPLRTCYDTFRYISGLLVLFLCISLLFAIPLTATTAVLYALVQSQVSLWICFIVYLWVSGLLFVFGSSAEALAYASWWLRRKWSTEDVVGGIDKQEYGLPVIRIYAVGFYFIGFMSAAGLLESDNGNGNLKAEKKEGLVEMGHGDLLD
ncbi:hypothetical protein F4781DRAFT_365250 [Annulohypoxylon bovei var. microspora]|nr:hypothetical protein F4781DRAFT_365250 [Annulohypoxylon bovei var. microspora]